jgi:hypothetical protein
MSTIQISRARPEHAAIGAAMISNPSVGVSATSKLIEQRLRDLTLPTPTFSGNRSIPTKNLDEQLYDALAAFKIHTASVAMHLDPEWRNRLFSQLNNLLGAEDWQPDDSPPSLASFSTFLRMLVLLRPVRRPGLGATSDGLLIAAWTHGEDRLTVECLPQDIARWNLALTIEGERERAAAITPVGRLNEVLRPYAPQRWFLDGSNVSPR